MGDSDIYWPVSSSDSLSMSWTAGSMDWGYESEIDPEDIFAAPNHIDYEEVECQASNEPELTIVDTESLVGNSLDVVEMENTSTIRRRPEEDSLMKVSLGMKHGKTTWTYMMIWMTGTAQEMNY